MATKWAKPEGFQGRGKGKMNYKRLKWEALMYKDGDFMSGKFSSIVELNNAWDLKLNSCIVQRLLTHKRVGEDKTRSNSFLERYQHIKLIKIDEPRQK